jgi:hypothetical protein
MIPPHPEAIATRLLTGRRRVSQLPPGLGPEVKGVVTPNQEAWNLSIVSPGK